MLIKITVHEGQGESRDGQKKLTCGKASVDLVRISGARVGFESILCQAFLRR